MLGGNARHCIQLRQCDNMLYIGSAKFLLLQNIMLAGVCYQHSSQQCMQARGNIIIMQQLTFKKEQLTRNNNTDFKIVGSERLIKLSAYNGSCSLVQTTSPFRLKLASDQPGQLHRLGITDCKHLNSPSSICLLTPCMRLSGTPDSMSAFNSEANVTLNSFTCTESDHHRSRARTHPG